MICPTRVVRAVSLTCVALVLLCLAALQPRVSADGVSSVRREVHVDLSATWNATSLVHEAAEWLGDDVDNPGKFYAFAEAMMRDTVHQTHKRVNLGADQCWNRLNAEMDSLVKGQMRLVSKVALTSRQYSPRLETFRQLSTSSDPGESTCCWAVVDGDTVVTDPSDILAELQKATAGKRKGIERVLDIDHRWNPNLTSTSTVQLSADGHSEAHVVVLYGPMDSSCSAAMHKAIVEAINTNGTSNVESGVAYVWRPIPFRPGACGDAFSCSTLGTGGRLVVPGYGVELALKSTEYNAQDDSTGKRNGDHLGKDEGRLLPTTNPQKLDIRLNSFDDIGKHVLEKLAASNDGLSLLKDITGDFPSMLDAMSEVPVREETSEAVDRLAAKVVPDAKLLLINGIAMNPQDLSWHGILEKIRAESEFMEKLHMLGIHRDVVPALVSKRVTRGTGGTNYRLDYRPTEEVLWLSDVEQDAMFESLSSDLNEFLELDFMGQRQPVRRNLFTGVMIIDPSTRAGASAISTASGLLRQGFPAKIGVVPVGGRIGDLMRAFVGTSLESGPRLAADVFAGAAARVPQEAWMDEESFAVAMTKLVRADPRAVFPPMPSASEGNQGGSGVPEATVALLERAAAAVKRLGVDLGRGRASEKENNDDAQEDGVTADNGGINGAFLMNGAVHAVASPSMWRSIFVSAWQAEGETLATLIEDGLLANESSDLLGDILKALGAVPRLNPRIVEERTGLGISAIVDDPFVDLHATDVRALLGALGGEDVEYLQDGDGHVAGSKPVPVTHWVFVGSRDDALVEEARLASSSGLLHSSRIGVVLLDSPLSRLLNIGDRPGVLTNGRFLRNRFDGDIGAEDIALLERMAHKEMSADDSLMNLVVESLSTVSGSADSSPNSSLAFTRKASDLAAVLSWIMTSYGTDGQVQPEAIALLNAAKAPTKIVKRSKFGFPTAPLQIRALFAPLSAAGQQLAPILAFLHDSFHVDIEAVLNVKTEYTELPLKSYYRYVLPVTVHDVDHSGDPGTEDWADEIFRPRAVIPSLPLQDILTLGMDVPESWLVSVVRSKHDLDNIQLGTIEETDVDASFSLDAILFTGMALDVERMIHPRGVQLELGSISDSDERVTDTLVMSNLGYFQLKANPGLWQLRLANGESRAMYRIQEIRHGQNSYGDGHDGVPVASFAGQNVFLLLARNDPKSAEAVDGGDETPTQSTSVSDDRQGDRHEDDTIHVFTVASGHMYERLQKIMILSAVKRSSRKLKFWFISNSISNQHREFIPIMASQYGFEYEFITFKWPTWLHKQTDKQRIIWAYKILFLDVMFPLGLQKVIFCDSDQVIRADLAELWDMDLGGKPYGYVPMCGGNGEDDMDRYRFWKTGYWHDHLRGLPYHISALYVVDLQRFRAMAAGDNLRVIYDNLAKDPNSLSNLDQDLPNFAQHEIPIHSLPAEWLWCETWCGAESRPQAKTIDLCNNPKTKEPKLASARRIVSEWPYLNDEVNEFTQRALGWLEGNVTDESLADTSYRVKLLPMVEGVVDQVGHDRLDHDQDAPAQAKIEDHDEL